MFFATLISFPPCPAPCFKTTGKSRGFAFVSIKDPQNILEKKILTRKH